MTLLSCFECDFQTASTDDLADHLWTRHRPEEADSFECPDCTFPVSEVTFSYHYPCLFEVDKPGLLEMKCGLLCPVCGGEFETMADLRSHVESYSELDVLEVLGDSGVCDNCGDPLSAGQFESHLECFFVEIPDSRMDAESTADLRCPSSACSSTFETEGQALYHVWSTHFNESGFFGSCPECRSKMSFGEIQAHLGCLSDFEPKSASRLLPNGKTCVLCGLSVYSPEVLHRHYHQKHTSSTEECPGCGETFTEAEGADVLDHIICIADMEGSIPLSDFDERWQCPACSETSETKGDLLNHLADIHVSDLRGEIRCEVCATPIDSIAAHEQCLLEKAQNSRRNDSDTCTHAPSTSHSQGEYFSELEEFVNIEKETAREEAWNQYHDRPLDVVLRQRAAISELVPTGEQYHPEFEHQLVYQIPTEQEKKNPANIVEKYGIFPGNEVILGGESGKHLPRAAVVTFVDSPSIGFALRPADGSVTNELLRELTKDEDVYHCVELINPTPFDRERKAIDQVESRADARDLVLGQKSFAERPVSLSDSMTGDLNRYQKRAVERALGTERFLCIHGPPGTGKTRTLTRLIRLAIARGERVLATSHSNQAIDNLLAGSSTPVEPDSDSLHYVASPAGSDRTVPYELEAELEENPDDEELRSAVDSLLNRPDEFTVSRVGSNSTSEAIRREYAEKSVQDADLVAGTMNALAELDVRSEFDMVVIDEAAQATQPASFIPMLRGSRLILAGDHLQLPPYAADEQAKEEEMHISLFEHLLDTYGFETSVMLQRQYRMNEEIAAFPSEYVYDGQLETGEQNRTWTINDLKPIMAVDVSGDEQMHTLSHSKENPTEAELVANHVKLLQMNDIDLKDIGVITPYTSQIKTIKQAVSNTVGQTNQLKIDTIDSFQGSEREAIIVSFVRSNPGHHSGFLALPEEGKRRLNVALTRAKKRLILIGDWNTLGTSAEYESSGSASSLYSALYQMLNKRGLVKQVQMTSLSD